MKKLFTLITVLALVSATFVSCEKDDSEPASNSITITGTFNVGEKEFTNPTFNLGSAEDHEGFLTSYDVLKAANGIKIYAPMDIDLGNNLNLYYEMEIYTAQTGTANMFCNVGIYEQGTVNKVGGFYLSCSQGSVTVSKIGEVGGYIEGTYEGDFYEGDKGEVAPYHVKGKFKVKRVDEPTK
ncbi:MAG TPA: hypothetical protein P5145_06310 [Tenuifilaceae bacterium]|nr:hypothetical protein [Tenuifilaceae bacterium]